MNRGLLRHARKAQQVSTQKTGAPLRSPVLVYRAICARIFQRKSRDTHWPETLGTWLDNSSNDTQLDAPRSRSEKIAAFGS